LAYFFKNKYVFEKRNNQWFLFLLFTYSKTPIDN